MKKDKAVKMLTKKKEEKNEGNWHVIGNFYENLQI